MNKVILMGRLTRDPEMRNSNGESKESSRIPGRCHRRRAVPSGKRKTQHWDITTGSITLVRT